MPRAYDHRRRGVSTKACPNEKTTVLDYSANASEFRCKKQQREENALFHVFEATPSVRRSPLRIPDADHDCGARVGRVRKRATGQDHRLRLGRKFPKGVRRPVVEIVL